MPFDPSNLTVKKAIAKLDGLPDDDLSSLYDSELEGKGRKSLLDAITSARDDIREEAPVEEEAPAPSVASVKEVEEISAQTFQRLSWHDRKCWKHIAPGRFVKIG